MRNLKKFLALVLAMMMVMGLMMTANAAPSTAGVTASYKNAAELTTALGLFKGQSSSSGADFAGDKVLTRAEFAALLYRFLTGDIKEANLAAYANSYPFNDVTPEQYSWAHSQIAWANAEGWMDGVGGNNFVPTRELTGIEVAIVLMRILGYDAANEFTGAGYDMRALQVYGEAFNSDDGNAPTKVPVQIPTSVLRSKITREMVSELFYEVLFTDMAVAKTDGSYSRIAMTAGEFFLEMKEGDDAALTEAQKTEVAALKATDAFGLPGAQKAYVINGVVVGINTPALVKEFEDGAFTGNDAKGYDSATTPDSTSNVDSTKVRVVWNGHEVHDSWHKATSNGLWLSPTAGIPGYEIAVYSHVCTSDCSNPCTYEKDLIFREAFVAKIGAMNEETEAITVTILGSGDGTTNKATSVAKDDPVYAKVAAFEKDQYVAVYPAHDWQSNGSYKILDAVELDTVDAKVTGVTNGTLKINTTFTADDGKTYGFHNEGLLIDKNGALQASTANIKSGIDLVDSTLYLHNGNVLLLKQNGDEAEAPAEDDAPVNSIFVIAEWETEPTGRDEWGNPTGQDKMFQGVLSDGTEVTGTWSKEPAFEGDDATYSDIECTGGNVLAGYQYTVDENGVYRFLAAAGSASSEGVMAVGAYSSHSLAITNSDKSYNSSIYYASDVKFILMNNMKGNLKKSIVNGVPTITINDTVVDYVVIAKNANDQYIIKAVFVYESTSATSAPTVTAAPTGTEAVSDDLMYVDNVTSTGKTTDKKGATADKYEVYINGEKTEITVKSGDVTFTAKHWYKFSIDAETGRYVLKSDETANQKADTAISVVDTGNGTYYVTIGDWTDYAATSDTVVVNLSTGTKTVNSMSTLATLLKGNGGTVKVSASKTSTNVVDVIYVLDQGVPA